MGAGCAVTRDRLYVLANMERNANLVQDAHLVQVDLDSEKEMIGHTLCQQKTTTLRPPFEAESPRVSLHSTVPTLEPHFDEGHRLPKSAHSLSSLSHADSAQTAPLLL